MSTLSQHKYKTRREIGSMSKNKGKVGERDVAKLLRSRGYEAKRGVQFQGGNDSPDVVSELKAMHIEVKRVERLRIYAAMAQARYDKNDDQFPTVWHRKSHEEWLVTLRAQDFLDILVKLYPPDIFDLLK